MFSTERRVRRLFADHGMTIHQIRRRGHWMVWASYAGGPIRRFTVPCTPSDYRVSKHLAAMLRRQARATK